MIRAAKATTLRDIAGMIGVTPTTVSLALRDNPRISPRMRSVIKQAADELGYRPNAELSRVMMKLKTRQRGEQRPRVALVLDEKLQTEAFDAVREDFVPIAEKMGYATDILRIAVPQMSYARLADILRTRSIRGALLYRLAGTVPKQEGWMDSLALCCVGPAPAGTKLPACMWADNPTGAKKDAPLLQAAMDFLDVQLNRNRFGAPAHGMCCMLT